jgi:hypothetical protein
LNRFTRAAAICLLCFFSILSGCSTIGKSIVQSMVHGHEFAQDSSLCEKRCSFFKEDEYTFCYRQCMTQQTERRRREREKAGGKDWAPTKAELDKTLSYQQK